MLQEVEAGPVESGEGRKAPSLVDWAGTVVSVPTLSRAVESFSVSTLVKAGTRASRRQFIAREMDFSTEASISFRRDMRLWPDLVEAG